MAIAHWFKSILSRYRIPYEEHRHPPVYSASHLAHVEHISGYQVAKTVLLNNRGRPLAVVLPACARLDLEPVQAIVGNKTVGLATETEVGGWFQGCHPGCVPPLPLRSDLIILMDRSFGRMGKFLMPAGNPEDAVVVRFQDWYRRVRPGVGRFAQKINGPIPAESKSPILVVEDETDTNDLFCQLLKSAGLDCQGVTDGDKALALASQIHPSAILLDLMLPDMPGFEVVERLRRTGPIKRIPFIVVSALDDEVSRRRCRELGADGYLTKPFLAQTLIEEFQEVLTEG